MLHGTDDDTCLWGTRRHDLKFWNAGDTDVLCNRREWLGIVGKTGNAVTLWHGERVA